ncbi:MAG: tyrosine-type recombinase/integrase [Clostridia bacterium]|nr:tyrosine-type recombinase/integrase [Clostridia bacterium]
MAGGSIRIKNGKYQWVGYLKDKGGKICRPTKTFNTRKEAEEYKALQASIPKHVENVRNKTNYTVEEFYKIWQKETQWTTEKYYKFTTTNNWRTLFAKHILPFIGKEHLQAIDYSKLQEHFKCTKLNRKTYRNILQAIKSMIAFAKDLNENLIIVDNLSKVRITAEKTPTEKVYNIMSETDYTDVINYMTDHKLYYANLISFLHETGLRIEEALALTPLDIAYEKNYMRVSKAIKRQNVSDTKDDNSDPNTQIIVSEYLKTGSSYRIIPLNVHAKRALNNQKEMLREKKIKTKLLFPTNKGKPSDARNVLRSFHNSIKACNKTRAEENQIPIRGLHSLRKMCCKRLKDESKFDWDQIANFLGHSTPEVSKRYYYSVSDDDMTKLAQQMNANDPRLAREKELTDFAGADGDVYFEISDQEKELMKELHDLDF